MIGNLPVNLEGAWETVEKFVGQLKGALVDEMKTIRETELDRPGVFRDAKLFFNGKFGKGTSDKVFIDRLDRIVTPADGRWEKLTAVRFVGGPIRTVVKNEFRYEGEQKVAIVHYLEKEELSHDN